MAKRNSSKGWRRLLPVSLRAEGVAVLSLPMAALFVALFSIYWVESDRYKSDLIVDEAYQARSELARLEGSLGNLDMARGLAARSFTHLDEAAAGDSGAAAALAELKNMAGGDSAGAAQDRIGQLNRYLEGRISGARQRREQGRQRLYRIVLLCGIVGPLGTLFIHLLLAGRLVRRLKLVEENARRLAHGLPMGPQPDGTDEIAALGRQLDDAAYLIDERKRELRESERRYRDLFDQAPIPYEETDTEGVVRRFNQAVCTLLRCTSAQVMGSRAWDFIPPEQQEEFRNAMRARIAAGTESGPFECEYLLEDGSQINVEIRENLIRNEAAEVTGVRRSLTDVTQRNLATMAARKVEQYAMELRNRNEMLARALNAARDATEAKSRFLASVSHELRTPLNGIIGFSELLYDEKLGPVDEGHRDVLGDILSSARHLLQLINDVLDLSKVEAGKMEFRPELCRLEPLVLEVSDVIRPLAQKKEITLTTSVPAGFTATIDPSRFKQVLYNYLSNAVKFTPDRGSVKVEVTAEGEDHFRLEVEDSGIGIAPDQVSSLFQEFQQLPNSRPAEQGTGLGLALTRHIVEAQSGRVGVRSRPGRGSAFSAVLPLRAPVVPPPV